MKFDAGGGDVIRAFEGRKNDTCKGILDKLETIKRSIREVVEEGVTIVKFRGNKRIGKDDSRIEVKRGSDLTKLADMEKRGSTDVGYMAVERKVRIKFNTKVTCVSGGRNGGATKG